MMNVYIDEDLVKDMLNAELSKWTSLDETERELMNDYLDSLVDDGLFDGCYFDPSQIVDDIYINGSYFAYENDSDWENLKIGTEEQDTRVYKVKDGVALVVEG